METRQVRCMIQHGQMTQCSMQIPHLNWGGRTGGSLTGVVPPSQRAEAQSTLREGCLRAGPPFLALMVLPEASIAAKGSLICILHQPGV